MKYLNSSCYFDFKHPNIQSLIKEYKNESFSQKEKAVQLYFKIRDGWKYNANKLSFVKEKWKASFIATKDEGNCIDKAILLTTCLRGLGIPSRLHFAKVKNHIAVEVLTEKFGTNELTPHGMVNVFLNKKWVKASPAFNKSLCRKCNVEPLDFNGEEDSIFQEYNNAGNEFMEYLEDYGHFEDVPFDFIIENLKSNYPKLEELMNGKLEFDFTNSKE